MRKPVQIIGTTLGAAALVGASAAAASAHDGSDHGGYGGADHHGFGRGYGGHDDHGYGGHGYDHHWYGDPRSDDQSSSDASSVGDHSFGDHVDHRWWGSHSYAHHDVTPPADRSGTDSSTSTDPGAGTSGTAHAWTFAQRKAAIVSSLQAADARLAAFEERLNDASGDTSASSGRSDQTSAALAYVMQARAHVESLLAQVQSATTDEELTQILEQAHSSGTPAPAPAV